MLIAKDGKTLLNNAYGYAHYEKNIFNNPATQFRIAPITKPITAAMILQLNERGLLKLTNTVSDYIPSFKRGNDITVHNLLSHTSGIYNFSLLEDINERLAKSTTAASIVEL